MSYEYLNVRVCLQELEKGINEAAQREAALEEQSARTEARLQQRIEAAEQRATAASHDDARHRQKVTPDTSTQQSPFKKTELE